ncbi:chlorite dismutase family protein [Phycisphaeraceae bacterium D3-23]
MADTDPPESMGKPIERPPAPKPPDLRERGGGGKFSDRRLFMQLLVFTGCPFTSDLIEAAKAARLNAVVYESLHDPRGAALLTWCEDPADFATKLRDMLRGDALTGIELLRDMTMLGRTYSIGYEPDLDEALFNRPIRHATNPGWPWAVWYPLRRSGAFAKLPRDEQMSILKEHGTIGFGFGAGDFAHDIRLASHGLDTHDNDFTIGLVGKDLAPLSKLVETMRKTKQTSTYIERLGPFFVGKAVGWSSDEASSS